MLKYSTCGFLYYYSVVGDVVQFSSTQETRQHYIEFPVPFGHLISATQLESVIVVTIFLTFAYEISSSWCLFKFQQRPRQRQLFAEKPRSIAAVLRLDHAMLCNTRRYQTL